MQRRWSQEGLKSMNWKMSESTRPEESAVRQRHDTDVSVVDKDLTACEEATGESSTRDGTSAGGESGQVARQSEGPRENEGVRINILHEGSRNLATSEGHGEVRGDGAGNGGEGRDQRKEEAGGSEEEVGVCRICLLEFDNDQPSEYRFDGEEGGVLNENNKLVMACHCKGDLAMVHQHCAFRWFSTKGTNICDICGVQITNLPFVPSQSGQTVVGLPNNGDIHLEILPTNGNDGNRSDNERNDRWHRTKAVAKHVRLLSLSIALYIWLFWHFKMTVFGLVMVPAIFLGAAVGTITYIVAQFRADGRGKLTLALVEFIFVSMLTFLLIH
eukprot:TRINITY_DN9577_c0_g1_i2.p1 TRINITY_DN9577_c0_g1~~TRINITY_DN9577_c0_g1_i2.p1  ORF type:complete len:329 (+),score=40.48 TRINITY_DN9577_c0_g1_i2:38-1024(+)